MSKLADPFLVFVVLLSVLSCQVSETSGQQSSIPPKPTPSPEKVDAWVHSEAPNAITRSIIQDQHGNIWFATFNGAIKYDGNGYTNMTLGTSDDRFFSVLEDRKGNIWFGTIGGGIYKYDGETFTNYTKEDGLIHEEITNIYEDRSGKIWFGTTAGISVYDEGEFHSYSIEYGTLNDDVNT
ncbi:MAG: two-component regulator propeller domain-containing protein, partial [Bacteroidota bacterium]